MRPPAHPPALTHLLSVPQTLLKLVNVRLERPSVIPTDWYYHWDTLRRIAPPEGLTSEEWWAAIKLVRVSALRPIPLQDTAGHPFHYTMPDPLLRMLHRIDQLASGSVSLPEPITTSDTRERYVQSTLIEEAFTSSALEGAVSTRREAQEMIRQGRKPRNRSEQMILNNYRAMEFVRAVRDRPLTPDLVIQLRERLVVDTLDEPSIFRKPGDGIGVFDNATNTLLHAPPPADEIEMRLHAMCDFANQTETGPFLHPVVKAIVLHFWLAYDHPFTDGNGRTARALFYWMMLRQGFWLVEFISISSILRDAPSKYARSFLYTETDGNDLTYFILAQLRVVERSIDAMYAHLERKADEMRRVLGMTRSTISLNVRQQALLTNALRHPEQAYTIQSHQRSHGSAYATARADLLGLAERGLLEQRKQGKKFIFLPADSLADRLRALDH
ncbi:MAG: Fic family protein [Rhodothermales bacterium]|nr:Fic family protein [Rhodothermales bacterium]